MGLCQQWHGPYKLIKSVNKPVRSADMKQRYPEEYM